MSEKFPQSKPHSLENTFEGEEAPKVDVAQEKAKLRGLVDEFNTLPKRAEELSVNAGVSAEREAMQESESKYLQAYKAFHRDNNILQRIAKNQLKNPEVLELQKLKESYDKTRTKYDARLQESVTRRINFASTTNQYVEDTNNPDKMNVIRAGTFDPEMERKFEERYIRRYNRLEEEGRIPTDENGHVLTRKDYVEKHLSPEYDKKRLDRYNSIVRFNEIIKPSTEKLQAARAEALDEKGKNALEASFGWLARKDKKENKGYVQNKMRALKVFAGSIIAAAGLAAVDFQNNSSPERPDAVRAAHSSQLPETQERRATPTPISVSESISVGERADGVLINDVSKLLGHFADKLENVDNFKAGTPGNPAAVETLFAELGSSRAQGEARASIDLGFQMKGGLSTIVQPGDKLSLENGQIILERPSDPSRQHVLIDEQGTIHPLDASQWPQVS